MVRMRSPVQSWALAQMKLLKEITTKTFAPEQDIEILGQTFLFRKSARAIVLNETGEMAVQYLETYDFHKLPGGGVDVGETIEEALERELQEELGARVKNIRELGVVIEYRTLHYNLLHISHGFVAELDGVCGETALEAEELEEGMKTLWLPPEEVLKRFKNDVPKKESGEYILARETAFLEEYLSGQW